VPSPLAVELAKWSSEFRTRWFNTDKRHKWSRFGRLFVAGLGAFVYLTCAAWTFARTDDYIDLFLNSATFERYVVVVVGIVVLFLFVAAILLGRFVVSQDGDGGPVRVFLSGVALPAVVVLIAKFSLWIF